MDQYSISRPLSPCLRAAQTGDAAALALVGLATFLETYATLLPVADLGAFCRGEHGEAAYAGFLADGARTWLVEDAGTGVPLGYALVTSRGLGSDDFSPKPGDIELKRIYVLSRCDGSGIAQILMATVVDTMTAAGHTRQSLGVHLGNARALSFYASAGFVPAGTRRFTVGLQSYDDLILARARAQTGTAS